MKEVKKEYSTLLFILMASTTALAILAELAPSGILLQMVQDLNINESKAGMMVGFYAFSSAVFTIPLIYKTLKINRKLLLQVLLVTFCLTNLAIGLLSSYPLIILARILGGTAAGLLWPMISAYGSRLVSEEEAGGVIALIMSGGTIGLVLGIPLLTHLGQGFHWRLVYLAIGGLAGLILVLSSIFLPQVQGQEDQSHQPTRLLLKNRDMRIILYLTILSITAYYSLYVYIAPLLVYIGYKGSITQAQFLFGIASFFSILVAMKGIRRHLDKLLFINLATGVLGIGSFLFFKGNQVLLSLGFFLWGLGYGSLSSLCQATVALRIPWARDMGNAIQSSSFNASIMVGAAIGGQILDRSNIKNLLLFSILLLSLSLLVSVRQGETFKPEPGL